MLVGYQRGAETGKRRSIFLSIEELANKVREMFPSVKFIVVE